MFNVRFEWLLDFGSGGKLQGLVELEFNVLAPAFDNKLGLLLFFDLLLEKA
jgi:hypothetical protein